MYFEWQIHHFPIATDSGGAHTGSSSSGELVGLTTALEEQEEVNNDHEIWAITRVICTAEEQIPCYIKKCSTNAIVSWASNLNPNSWDLYEDCQVDEKGGWPNGFDKKDKKSGSADKPSSTKKRKLTQPSLTATTKPKKLLAIGFAATIPSETFNE